MNNKIYSATLAGLEAKPVEIEADVSRGLPNFIIVGLPDSAVQESKERVRSAIKNSGLPFPNTRLTINLAPADLKKEGAYFDLPIALSILHEILGVKFSLNLTEKDLVVGELALNGNLRSVKGVLSLAILAKEKGFTRLIVPNDNVAEASLVSGLVIVGVKTLQDLINYLSGSTTSNIIEEKSVGITNEYLSEGFGDDRDSEADFSYIRGQEQIKRALEIAASGGHNVFMIGPPGAGKTLLAKALATILPPLTKDEVIEITRLYSVAGIGPSGNPLVKKRPFRQPHHSASIPALVGGGNVVKPGEISLAHRGVLFLDELGEFNRSVLESLRGPLEEGTITVARASGSVKYPAQFILVVAQNPCPCGYYRDLHKSCTCTIGQVQKYHKKISGPLLDRIDMHLEVPAVKIDKLSKEKLSESSGEVRKRVTKARARQEERLKDLRLHSNAELTVPQIREKVIVSKEAKRLLNQATENLHLSARAYFRMIKLAQTIADLDDSDEVKETHIAEALQHRPVSYMNF